MENILVDDLVNEHPPQYTPFVTVFLYIMIILVSFLMIPYFSFAIFQLATRDVEGLYDTISSHCADPRSRGHRFLLILTCIVGSCLTALFVDEYNSYENATEKERILFWLELVAVLMLPMIGIFHTDGGGRIREFRYLCLNLPISVSNALHVFGTFAFLCITSGTNVDWVLNLADDMQHKTLMQVLSFSTVAFVGLFIIFQILIKMILKPIAKKMAGKLSPNSTFFKVSSVIFYFFLLSSNLVPLSY